MLWKTARSWCIYLGTLAAALWVSLWAFAQGMPDWLVVAGLSFAASVWLLFVQWLLPFSQQWRGWRKAFGLDVLHGVFSTLIASSLFRAVFFGVVFKVSAVFSLWLGVSLWPTSWPLALQLLAALVLGEFGIYWLHRTAHEREWLWRIHALHHSSEQLYVLSSGRNHPFNTVLAYGVSLLPLIALGANTELLILVSVFTSVHGLLQHANIDMRLGVLDWVFAGPDLHRWHHSVVTEESMHNYGSNLIVWDIVFGTRWLPSDRSADIEVGLPDMTMGKNYFRDLASPFIWRRMFARPEQLPEAPPG
jgi:sterol desaturase/sphingolipid hydroxylase (fatty acid hydroxylase superfamily)